jgi:hypothetical protein
MPAWQCTRQAVLEARACWMKASDSVKYSTREEEGSSGTGTRR